jgi:BirA family biotin operon repressor/biotin-[acetyl-CoA-carboxylase] ligase
MVTLCENAESRGGEGSPMPSLNAADLARELVRPHGLWRGVRVVAETGSTNSDLLADARSGMDEGAVLVADLQTAGRGRKGRQWVSPPAAGLTFSVLLRPRGVPPALLGWAPLLAGLAAASGVRAEAAVDVRLKWPNDLLVGPAKLAGVLAESWEDAIVVGFGINVCQRAEDLPGPEATSVLLAAPAGTAPQRDRLLVAVLGELARWYTAWRDQQRPGDPDACGLRAEYLRWSATVGRQVTVSLPGGQALAGTAVGIDRAGRLEVQADAGPVEVSAGDVVHVR